MMPYIPFETQPRRTLNVGSENYAILDIQYGLDDCISFSRNILALFYFVLWQCYGMAFYAGSWPFTNKSTRKMKVEGKKHIYLIRITEQYKFYVERLRP